MYDYADEPAVYTYRILTPPRALSCGVHAFTLSRKSASQAKAASAHGMSTCAWSF
jgi:hypothetical protein